MRPFITVIVTGAFIRVCLNNVIGMILQQESGFVCQQSAAMIKKGAFVTVSEWLEQCEDQYISLSSFHQKMREIVDKPYSVPWTKELLIRRYGDSIVFSQMEGCSDVMFFRQTTNSLLYNFYCQGRCKDDKSEAVRVIKLAANIIQSEVASMERNDKNFFCLDDLDEMKMFEYLPCSVHLFLCKLAPRRSNPRDIKFGAIGQSLVQLCRPKSLTCPLQISLGTEVHHKTGSEFIVEMLHSFGFSSSIKQVRDFENSLCFHEVNEGLTDTTLKSTLYSADNADVMKATIDGKNTLHMMGIIRSSVLKKKTVHLPVIKINPSKDQLLDLLPPVKYIPKVNKHDINLVLKPFSELAITPTDNWAANFNTLRISACVLKPVTEWSGFMRIITAYKPIPGKHTVEFLPFIDLNPNDCSTIYSTLLYVINQCEQIKIEPVLTFDQPLWYKAMMIKKKYGLDITLLLGNFHGLMSFQGSIGYVIKNSGIKEAMS